MQRFRASFPRNSIFTAGAHYLAADRREQDVPAARSDECIHDMPLAEMLFLLVKVALLAGGIGEFLLRDTWALLSF